jgi:hypothetical protein
MTAALAVSRPAKRRQLPDSTRHHIDVPTLGRFALQSVGNTSYTTGLDVYFQPAHARDCLRTIARFTVTLDALFHPVWHEVACRAPDSTSDAAADVATLREWGLRLAKDLPNRDPIGYMFHLGDAIARELRDLRWTHHHYEDSITSLQRHIAKSPAAAPEAIARWRDRTSELEADLFWLTATYQPRADGLRQVDRAIHAWAERARNHAAETIVDVIANALASARASLPIHSRAPIAFSRLDNFSGEPSVSRRNPGGAAL